MKKGILILCALVIVLSSCVSNRNVEAENSLTVTKLESENLVKYDVDIYNPYRVWDTLLNHSKVIFIPFLVDSQYPRGSKVSIDFVQIKKDGNTVESKIYTKDDLLKYWKGYADEDLWDSFSEMVDRYTFREQSIEIKSTRKKNIFVVEIPKEDADYDYWRVKISVDGKEFFFSNVTEEEIPVQENVQGTKLSIPATLSK